MKFLTCLTLILVGFGCPSMQADEQTADKQTPAKQTADAAAGKAEETKVAAKKESKNVYEIPVKTLEGEALDLKKLSLIHI